MISDRAEDRNREEAEKSSQAETDIQSVSRTNLSSPSRLRKTPRMIAPFIASHDIPRGAIHALQALLGYALMLAVMYAPLFYLVCDRGSHEFRLFQDLPSSVPDINCGWIRFRRAVVWENRWWSPYSLIGLPQRLFLS